MFGLYRKSFSPVWQSLLRWGLYDDRTNKIGLRESLNATEFQKVNIIVIRLYWKTILHWSPNFCMLVYALTTFTEDHLYDAYIVTIAFEDIVSGPLEQRTCVFTVLWNIGFPSRERWFIAHYKRFGFSKLRESSCVTQSVVQKILVLLALPYGNCSGEMVHDNADSLPTAIDASNKVLCLWPWSLCVFWSTSTQLWQPNSLACK